ncbi:MAG: hypothetical protein ACRC7O_09515 [Fimbriiglobus sp.]
MPVFVFLCAGVMLLAYLAFEVGLFRLSCLVCGVPRPGAAKSVGVVLGLLLAPILTDGIQTAIVVEVYQFAGYPLWEAGVVNFVLALPVHLLLCSALHARMMGLTFRECLPVWFVEKSIKFGLLLIALGVAAVFVFAGAANR